MEWVNISKTYSGTQPEVNSFIVVLNGFTLQLKRDFHLGSWTLTGWGNGLHLEPTDLLTKDPKEAQGKAIKTAQRLLKDKMNFLIKLMNEVHMIIVSKASTTDKETKEPETNSLKGKYVKEVYT